MCTSDFKSSPLWLGYTYVKSRYVLLILKPPPLGLAKHMSSLDVYFSTSYFRSTPLSPCYTHVKSRCVLLISNPPPFRLATHMSSLDVYFFFQIHPPFCLATQMSSLDVYFFFQIHPPFALLHTCQVSMCTSYFKSTPLSPCYTHVKSRCILLILNPPPFRLATHMSSLDVYFFFQIHPPFALLHRCQVSMCTSSFKSTPLLPCYTHVKSRCVLLISNPPPFRLATHMSSLDVYFLF